MGSLRVEAGARRVLDGVSFTLEAGEIVALVGESGSGKSVTARALLGLLPFRPGWTGGEITVVRAGERRPIRTEADFVGLRGDVLGLLFQDARAALDPLWSVGRQVVEAARLGGDPATNLTTWLTRAGLRDADRVARAYPHELSGGMAQRVAIALALARRSPLLIADEPTTGLDPTVQRAILAELRSLAAQGHGLLFITHDLRLLPGFADRVMVMEGGRIVEESATPGELQGAGRRLVEATRKVAGGGL